MAMTLYVAPCGKAKVGDSKSDRPHGGKGT